MSTETAFACTKCSTTLFVRVEQIIVDQNAAPIRTDEFGFRCSNCLQIFTVSDSGIVPYSDAKRPAVAAGSQQLSNRVRSSTTAANRGVEGATGSGREFQR